MKVKKTFLTTLVCTLNFAFPGLGSQNRDFEQPPTEYCSIDDTFISDNLKICSLTAHLTTEWLNYTINENPNFDLESLTLAIIYGAEKHDGQTRKDAEATPYIIHPLQVCYNLWEIGQVRNSNILISAILHDTLEDTSATEHEIQQYFGSRVCETIKEVTNDPNLDSNENKQRQIDHVPLMSQDARLVKLADRLANIVDLRTPPPSWNREKVDGYFNWGQKLLTALKGTNANLEAALEKEIENHQQ